MQQPLFHNSVSQPASFVWSLLHYLLYYTTYGNYYTATYLLQLLNYFFYSWSEPLVLPGSIPRTHQPLQPWQWWSHRGAVTDVVVIGPVLSEKYSQSSGWPIMPDAVKMVPQYGSWYKPMPCPASKMSMKSHSISRTKTLSANRFFVIRMQ